MSICSIHLSLLIAKLNDLTIYQANVGNAYLEAYTKEKIYFIARREFTTLEWKVMYSLNLKHYVGYVQVVNYSMKFLLKNSSSPFILISSLQRSITLLALLLSFLKIACLHVSFTAYENNFYKLSKMHCLLILFSTFFPSENGISTIKHISTYTLFHPSISTYVVDHFLVISCL